MAQVEGITVYFEGNDVKFDQTLDDMKKGLQLLKKMTSTYMKEFKKTGDIDQFARAIGNLVEEQTAAQKNVRAWADEVARLAAENKKGTAEYKNAVKTWQSYELELVNIGIRLDNNLEKLREFIKYADLGNLNERLQETGERLEGIGSALTDAGNSLKDFSKGAQDFLKSATDQAISFESAFADVKKTVNATKEEYDELSEGVRELSKVVPTSAQDLAKIMGLAGQMNVPTDQLVDFTRAMVDFDNATNITATDAVQDIAQIYNVIGKGGDFSTLENLLSTIVELGNNTATTEKDIVEMFTNIAAASSRVGMTEQQMAALAATLSSLNLDKGGASAISKILTTIDMQVSTNGKKLKEWADAANMSVSEFKAAWGEDAAGALTAILKGMSETTQEGGSLNQMLDELGVSELRQIDTLSRLVNAQGEYEKNIGLANNAYKDGNALSVEAAKRYETVESRLQILKNTWNEFTMSIGELFIPVINKAIDMLTGLLDWVDKLGVGFEQFVGIAAAVAAALSPLLVGFGSIFTVVGGFVKSALAPLILGAKNLLNTATIFGTTLGQLLIPIGLVIAMLVDLYNSNESFRMAVDNLIATIGGTLKAAIELIITIFQALWAIIKKVVEIVIGLWDQFKETVFGRVFIQLMEDIINIVTDVINFVRELIGVLQEAANWFLNLIGLSSELGATSGVAGMRVGHGEIAPMSGGYGSLNSGGFQSGGITLNASFNVQTNNVTRNDVEQWSGWLVDSINTKLGQAI